MTWLLCATRPGPRSVQTYIQWIWSVYRPTLGYGLTPKEVKIKKKKKKKKENSLFVVVYFEKILSAKKKNISDNF